MSDRSRRICGCFLLFLSLLLLSAGLMPFRPAAKASFEGKEAGILPVNPVETLSGMDLLNHGSPEELTVFPGIGPSLAEEILKEKTNHGPFWYPEDLMNVKGIGVKKMEQIRQLLPAKEDESED